MHEKDYISICPEIYALGFSMFVVEKLGEKRYPLMYYNMAEISEICLLFVLLLKCELFEVDLFSKLRLIFIWQVL